MRTAAWVSSPSLCVSRSQAQTSPLEPVRGWYPLLFGDYATRAEAEAALEDLSESLKRQGPLVRELGPDSRRQPTVVEGFP